MKENKYSWNQTLKFSWGHIIAFVALIFISYVAYMGDFYRNGGDFASAALKVAIMDVVLLFTFIGAQVYKGSDEHFNRSLIIERILVCLCPIAFVLAMLPYNHFWSVFSEREQIETKFNQAIGLSRQMFDDYDQYSDSRIAAYKETLDNVIKGKSENPEAYAKAGFDGVNDIMVKDNYIETLKLQLKSENTDSLRRSAIEWIDNANQGASVWNAFLIGNINKISDAVDGWNKLLSEASAPKLSNEAGNAKPFDSEMSSCASVKSELKQLQNTYAQTSGVSINTIWTGIVLFMMLIFPYFLQSRNLKAAGYYSLFPTSSKRRAVPTENKSNAENHAECETSDSDADIYGGTF